MTQGRERWMHALRASAWFWLGVGVGPIPLLRMHAISAQMREEIGIVGLLIVVAALFIAFAAFITASVLRFARPPPSTNATVPDGEAPSFDRWP